MEEAEKILDTDSVSSDELVSILSQSQDTIQNFLGAGSSFSDNIKLQCSLLLFSIYV